MVDKRDLSSGLPAERDGLVPTQPDEPSWCENLLFCLYDPKCDIGFWLHLGTVPTEWSIWEDRVFTMLPGDQGVLSMCGYHKTAPERKPAASCLAFECLAPFRRWNITFDGFGLHTSNAEMAKGRARDRLRQRLILDLEVTCETPVWDAHLAAQQTSSMGAMREQNWAKEHLEQLVRARGRVRTESGEFDFDGTGWRDHSRGPRGEQVESTNREKGAPWGGHVIQGCLFPSGRGIGFSRYWTPDGEISLEGGYVVDEDGNLDHVKVVDGPRLTTLEMSGERLPIHLRGAGHDLKLEFVTTRSMWIAMADHMVVGADLEDDGLVYALNFGTVDWDGETGWLYSERSDMLNRLAPALTAQD